MKVASLVSIASGLAPGAIVGCVLVAGPHLVPLLCQGRCAEHALLSHFAAVNVGLHAYSYS